MSHLRSSGKNVFRPTQRSRTGLQLFRSSGAEKIGKAYVRFNNDQSCALYSLSAESTAYSQPRMKRSGILGHCCFFEFKSPGGAVFLASMECNAAPPGLLNSKKHRTQGYVRFGTDSTLGCEYAAAPRLRKFKFDEAISIWLNSRTHLRNSQLRRSGIIVAR